MPCLLIFNTFSRVLFLPSLHLTLSTLLFVVDFENITNNFVCENTFNNSLFALQTYLLSNCARRVAVTFFTYLISDRDDFYINLYRNAHTQELKTVLFYRRQIHQY